MVKKMNKKIITISVALVILTVALATPALADRPRINPPRQKIPLSSMTHIKTVEARDNNGFVYFSLPFADDLEVSDLRITHNGQVFTFEEASSGGNRIVDPVIFAREDGLWNYYRCGDMLPGAGRVLVIYVYTTDEIVLSAAGNDFQMGNRIKLEKGMNFIGIPHDQPVNVDDIVVLYHGQNFTWSEVTNPTYPPPIVDPVIFAYEPETQRFSDYFCEGELLPGEVYLIYCYNNSVELDV
jgi:hypothetical protein